MIKHTLLALSLGLAASATWAQNAAQNGSDNLARRNSQISRHCTDIVRNQFNYAQAPADQRASLDRTHASSIESCYQQHKVTSASPAGNSMR